METRTARYAMGGVMYAKYGTKVRIPRSRISAHPHFPDRKDGVAANIL